MDGRHTMLLGCAISVGHGRVMGIRGDSEAALACAMLQCFAEPLTAQQLGSHCPGVMVVFQSCPAGSMVGASFIPVARRALGTFRACSLSGAVWRLYVFSFSPLSPGPIGLVSVLVAKMMGAAAVVITGKSF